MGPLPWEPPVQEVVRDVDLLGEVEALRRENWALRQENAELRADRELFQRKFLEVTEALVGLTQQNEALKARVLVLEQQLLESQRAAKRQAAPHRRRKRIPESEQKRPGRKQGHEPAYRRPPEQGYQTTTVPLCCDCPDCGLELEDVKEHEHFVEDIPPVKPVVNRYITYSGRCPGCRKRYQSKHPDMPSTAVGAAGVSLGHRAVALAGQMRAQLGSPFRKMASFLKLAFGLSMSHAGILGALERATRALKPTYQAIQEGLVKSEVVCADETGWRLLCASAWLWVFTNQTFTLYVIRRSRGHEVPEAVLGKSFQGILLTDFFAAYRVLDCRKAKCIAHLLRALVEILELQSRGAVRFPRAAIMLLQGAMALKRQKKELSEETYRGLCCVYRYRLALLLESDIQEPKNLRIAKRMRKYEQELLVFLDHDDVEPTNNQAERQIRPAVLQRKISAGNRSERGAQLHSILLSVWATACQQGVQFASLVARALQNPLESVLPALPPARSP